MTNERLRAPSESRLAAEAARGPRGDSTIARSMPCAGRHELFSFKD